ncbi:MAG: tRNA (guanosine(37)-N1)-methyltransferase TrmD [Opitutaceae bacterium]|nr:tRNA (guanosine(37)-N1)-methyltransferase TrmD [Opitutaceae bacterium]|tara:strand:- start:4309 stop:5016 length:708 start_codon:yes stop_codon:yes gene_type:complete
METALEIDLLTLFPGMAEGYLEESMLGRALKRGLLTANVHDIRGWATGKHKVTDDRPFGGGAGMVMKPEPLFAAIESVKRYDSTVIYMAPDGEKLTRELAKELSTEKHLVLLSGHYEGIDQRVRDSLVDREISIGDYVLTNGTIAACVVVDSLSRYIPGVLGEEKSLTQDSFTDSLLTFPQFTRPAEFRGMHVPEVLLSGNHAEIEAWRLAQRKEKTKTKRPDIISPDSDNEPSN